MPKPPVMTIAVTPPVEPMLAKRAGKLPSGEGWLFEPKWDGFRTLVFRDGDALYLQSRDKKPLRRYFPELVAPLLEALPPRCALDGEVVIARDGALDFDALQMRIHPAASRVEMLSETIPASIVFWDLLCLGDESLMKVPFAERRARLEAALGEPAPPVHLTPITTRRDVAGDWFTRFEGAGFDGVMAKQPDGVYAPKKRSMVKVKHQRTADCVVAGFRWHKNSNPTDDDDGDLVGSLLLALYDDEGELHHIGVAASFTEKRRRELVAELSPYRGDVQSHPWAAWAQSASAPEGSHGGPRRPGGNTSRWNAKKDLSFVPLRPELVVEVSYDHMQGRRLRHTAHFKRWRPDKPAAECTYAQMEVVPPEELKKIFAS